jgi:predicted transcriptional regulator
MKKLGGNYDRLSRRDQQILETVADLGEATAQEVLNGCGLEVGLSTVRTFLSRLEQRGFLDFVKRGRAHLYQLTPQARRAMLNRAMRNVLSVAETPARAAALFLDGTAEKLSASDIRELKELLENLESEAENDN